MEVISSTIRKNRKNHICDACCRVFGVGVEMNNVVVADQGCIDTWRECPTCTELLKKYPENWSDGFGILDAGCVDNYREIWETPEELLQRLNKVEI